MMSCLLKCIMNVSWCFPLITAAEPELSGGTIALSSDLEVVCAACPDDSGKPMLGCRHVTRSWAELLGCGASLFSPETAPNPADRSVTDLPNRQNDVRVESRRHYVSQLLSLRTVLHSFTIADRFEGQWAEEKRRGRKAEEKLTKLCGSTAITATSPSLPALCAAA